MLIVYLYQQVFDKLRKTIGFFLSTTRSAKAAQLFLAKAQIELKSWEYPNVINTNKAPAYGLVIRIIIA
ncbi:DDE-type integrase/transposase/recombinase [Vibrio owensii]|uniref:DDE-type integrase/transposase/recombinase n=1 Tax=Vibrio owensii TaxID=696485 RepID=UPI000689EE4A